MSMLISTCPKCGSKLDHICITTIPPINVVRCPECNWRLEETEPPLFDYNPNIDKATEKSEESDILNYFSLKEWKILEQGLNVMMKQGVLDANLSDFTSLANKVIDLRRKKQEIEKIIAKYHGFTVNPDDLNDDDYTISMPKSESTTATINEEKQDDEQLVFPCTNCHKTECQGCVEYGDYITKKYGTDTRKSPCITKGCDRSTREICCGCPDYFEWFEQRKKNKIDVDVAIKGNINPCEICSLSQEEKETCKGCRKLFKYVNDVYDKPNNPED